LAAAANSRIDIAFETSLSKKISAQIKVQSGNFAHQNKTPTTGEYNVSGYGFIPEIRLHPFRAGQASEGKFFVGMDFRYLRFSEQYVDRNQSTSAHINLGTLVNCGLEVGYKQSYKRLWVEMLVGYGVGSIKNDYDSNSHSIPPGYTDNLFLKNEKKFARWELSIGCILGKSKRGAWGAVSAKK
jgi:hypothetical protein